MLMNNNWFVVAVLLLTAAMSMVTPGIAQIAEDDNFLEAPAPSEPAPILEFVKDCSEKVSDACGERVFASVFGDQAFADSCCGELVSMGKACHDSMVNFFILLPTTPSTASEIKPKSEQLFNHCLQITPI